MQNLYSTTSSDWGCWCWGRHQWKKFFFFKHCSKEGRGIPEHVTLSWKMANRTSNSGSLCLCHWRGCPVLIWEGSQGTVFIHHQGLGVATAGLASQGCIYENRLLHTDSKSPLSHSLCRVGPLFLYALHIAHALLADCACRGESVKVQLGLQADSSEFWESVNMISR